MSAKTEASPAAAPAAEKEKEKEKTPASEKGGSASEKSPAVIRPEAAGAGKMAWIAAIAAVVLAPAMSWAVAQFVLLPRLQKKLADTPPPAVAAAPGDAAAPADGAAGATDGKAKAPPPTYEFSNLVVNLSGTMGTRYLKASFIVTGTVADLPAIFESNKARLTDVTLNVLSSLTLADLEEPGSKNVLREKLVSSYNQALNRKVADQVYFSDFVVQ